MRDDLYTTLMVAFARAGIMWDSCRIEDRGDGAYVLIPAAVPKPALAGTLVAALDSVLSQPRLDNRPWPRLRLSLHAGEVTFDVAGSSGRDVDHAFALVDASEARKELCSDAEARMVVVASDPFHDAIERSGMAAPSEFSPLNGGFKAVPIATKQGEKPAWMRLLRGVPAVYCKHTRGSDWRVLIGPPYGPACGPGVLFSGQFVLTCAHLIPGGRGVPRDVAVEFTGAAGEDDHAEHPSAPAEVMHWVPAVEGREVALAVLRLNTPLPYGTRPARLARMGNAGPGRLVTVSGAVAWPAEVLGPDPATGVGLRLRPIPSGRTSPVIRCHCCCAPGTAVIDEESGDVIGMVIEHDNWGDDQRIVMLPTEAMALRVPQLNARVNNWRARRSTGRVSVLEFGIALSQLQTLDTEAHRNQVISLLRPSIRAVVTRYPECRQDVVSLVRTSLNYSDGLDELLMVLQALEGDSRAMQHIITLRSQLDMDT